MLDRNGRNVDAEHPAGLASVVAGRADHVLTCDDALVGRQLPLTARRLFDGSHFGLLVDLGAAGAGTLAQRHGQVGRRDVAVVRVVESADDLRRVAATEVDERPELLDFLRRNDLERHADGVGRAAVLQVLVHAVLAGGQAQVAGHVKADVLTGFRRQALVQVDRVLVELADRVAHVEEWQQAGGVPCRAGRQLGALKQHDIRPAFLDEVVKRTDANDTAADHDHSSMSLH